MTPEQVSQVLGTAVRAPSVHNTQPWQFTVDGDVLDVRADRGRQLRVQDPRGRELLVSCGAAAVHAYLAVRGLDLAGDLQWRPDAGDTDLVARLVVGGSSPATPQERQLLEAAERRHTDRSAFAALAVPEEVVELLRRAAEQDGVRLIAEQQPDRVLELEVLVARADQVQRQDPEVRAELARWVHAGSGPGDVGSAGRGPAGDSPAEGLPAGALPDHGRGRGSSLTLRDFDPKDGPVVTGDAPPVPEQPLLLALTTDGDGPLDWVRAGGALARVLLSATVAELVVNPQTQVLEVPGLRSRLQDRLGLMGPLQMLLRVGYPAGAGSPRTGRRPIGEVLTGTGR